MNDAPFMAHEGRNCRPPVGATPAQIRFTTDLWFPVDGGEHRATRLCRGCPIETECATWAIERPELVGVFGATTTSQRARLRAEGRVA